MYVRSDAAPDLRFEPEDILMERIRAASADVRTVAPDGREAEAELHRMWNHAALAWRYRSWVPRRLRAIDDWQDIVSATWMKCYVAARRGRYDPDGRFGAWLETIAKRTAWREGRRMLPLSIPEDELARTAVESHAEPLVDLEDDARVVLEASTALPAELREIWLLVDGGGLSPIDAARTLGVPPVTTRTRLHRARRTLRDVVERRERRPGRSS